MKYFRYKNSGRCFAAAEKEYYKSLSGEERKAAMRQRFFHRLAVAVGIAVFFGGFFAVNMLIGHFLPKTESILLGILIGFGVVLLEVVCAVLLAILAYNAGLPFEKISEKYKLPPRKKELFSAACKHLRGYYGLGEPYIVTKCFESSDERFKMRDVILFTKDGELRITGDIMRGFLHGDRDLGCYCFGRDEIALSKQETDGRLTLELIAEEERFLLGYRAKGFIEREFLIKGE